MKNHCRLTWLNCYFGIIYLIYRKKIKKIGILKSVANGRLHMVGFTKSGSILHFRRMKPFCGINRIWFRGRFDGVPKSKIVKLMGERNIVFNINL
jgi:hypothetical protein